MSLPNSELTASVPDPKNAILGTKMTPRLSIFQDFSSGRCPEVPPGAPGRPRGELDCIYCSGLHAPPRDPVYTLPPPAPAPGPRETTLNYCFLTLFLYLLASNTCLLVDPHAPTLVPRGRRILLGCAHCRRPRKRSPNNDTLRGLEGTRIDCPKNVGMLNRFKN